MRSMSFRVENSARRTGPKPDDFLGNFSQRERGESERINVCGSEQSRDRKFCSAIHGDASVVWLAEIRFDSHYSSRRDRNFAVVRRRADRPMPAHESEAIILLTYKL